MRANDDLLDLKDEHFFSRGMRALARRPRRRATGLSTHAQYEFICNIDKQPPTRVPPK